MKKIILMRHSISEKTNIETELIPLSNDGIEMVKSKKRMLSKIDKVYSSNYLRAIQTAKCFSDDVIILDDLKERIIGIEEEKFWIKQYQNYDYKNYGGESLNEVKMRMDNCINNIMKDMNDDETVLIVSHATAICSYLLNFGKIEVTNFEKKQRKYTFNDKVIFDATINPTSYFVLTFENNNLSNIKFVN